MGTLADRIYAMCKFFEFVDEPCDAIFVATKLNMTAMGAIDHIAIDHVDIDHVLIDHRPD